MACNNKLLARSNKRKSQAAATNATMPTFRIDWPATLYRLAHVVAVLANCPDLCGFVPDQAEAQRAIDYCRRRLAGEPEEEDDNSLIEFIVACGQSVDWVLFGDPGMMICKLAAGTLRSNPDGGEPVEMPK